MLIFGVRRLLSLKNCQMRPPNKFFAIFSENTAIPKIATGSLRNWKKKNSLQVPLELQIIKFCQKFSKFSFNCSQSL